MNFYNYITNMKKKDLENYRLDLIDRRNKGDRRWQTLNRIQIITNYLLDKELRRK